MRTHSDKWISGLHLVVALLFALATSAAAAQSPSNPKHFFWAPGQPNTPSASALANDLIYHGGNAGSGAIGVETVPATYLIFWGPDWANGFTTTDANGVAYTSQVLQSYVTSFLSSLGGTSCRHSGRVLQQRTGGDDQLCSGGWRQLR